MACPMSNSQKNVQDRFLKHSIFFNLRVIQTISISPRGSKSRDR